MSEITYVTKEGLAKLNDELKQLKTVERAKIASAISEAREKGDLREKLVESQVRLENEIHKRPIIAKTCDKIVFVPQAHGDSLNVGHAAAITMFELGREGPKVEHDGRAACT